MTARLVLFAALAFLLVPAWAVEVNTRGYATADELKNFTPDPDLGFGVRSAAMIGNRLILVGQKSGLVSIHLDTGAREVLSQKYVQAVGHTDAMLWAIEYERLSPDSPVLIRSFREATHEDLPPLPKGTGFPVALVAIEGEPTIITFANLARWDGERWIVTPLSMTLETNIANDPKTVMSRDGRAIFVGSDAGEWGGHFYRIDVANGEVRDLNEGNVAGLVADIERKDCVLAAVSGAHGVESVGVLLRQCADGAEELFKRTLPNDQFVRDASEPISDIAISGDGTIWIAGLTRFYAINDGLVVEHSYEPPELIGGTYVGRSLPDVTLFWGIDSKVGFVRSNHVRLLVPTLR